MARTKPTPRSFWPRETEIRQTREQMREFEQKMRKYYPKKSRFFYNGSHYQPNRADNFQNPNSLVPQRYKRDFFRLFCAGSETEAPKLSRIPHNLRHFTIYTGSLIVLKKLIKQNKRLQHIVFAFRHKLWNDEERIEDITKFLKYSKSLRSIEFQNWTLRFSETECRRIVKTWGKTIEKINTVCILGNANVMENLLRLPKLREFQLKSFSESFPYGKLQERNIPYSISIRFGVGDSLKFESLMKHQPQCKPSDYVRILKTYSSYASEKMSLKRFQIEKNSKQKLFLYAGYDRYKKLPLSLDPIFQNILSLDLTVSENRWEGSDIGQLSNLKHLSINMRGEEDYNDYDYNDDNDGEEQKDKFGDFFEYLKKNVAPHKKLETFLIKAGVRKEKKQNRDLALYFFEACSETLRKVHFEFTYLRKESEDAECFYEGLSKLKNLQSLGLSLDFGEFECHKTIEKLCQTISEITSLEELDFHIQKKTYQGKGLDLKFPPQLKKLSLGMDTSPAPFDFSEALWPISNLTHLELEFTDLSSPKWGKILDDIIDKIKVLEVLVLKKTQEVENEDGISQMKEKLDKLMKESLSLKLILFANMKSKDIIILKRSYLWPEINPIIDDLSVEKDMKVNYIKSYT